ncbi:hypothetical protein KJ766_03425, partial [Patescibacteria group bacterium]|nr:hypothetical protein [Patescibacteria group bacterium]
FEAYKRAKGKLFKHLTQMPDKKHDSEEVLKIGVVNDDDSHVDYFASFPADRTIRFSWEKDCKSGRDTLCASYQKKEPLCAELVVNEIVFKLNLAAEYQHKNAFAAISAVNGLGFSLSEIASAAEKLKPLAGRFECIEMGQDFSVIVDYAYEPYAIKALLKSVKDLHPKRIIGIHGSAGGGRDIARRSEIGKLAGKHEDIVIVTNEDPYDEDPRNIIEMVGQGAKEAGKVQDKDLFLIDDRAQAIAFAISKAQSGDAIIITGKGNEPVIAVANGKKIPWSDRKSAEKAIKKRI